MRQDDGIGPILARKLKQYFRSWGNITVEERVQLVPEDSCIIAENDIVVFIDASVDSMRRYDLVKIKPQFDRHFSPAVFSPSYLMALSGCCFQTQPEGYIFSVRGYSFEVNRSISRESAKNLGEAFVFITKKLKCLSWKKPYE